MLAVALVYLVAACSIPSRPAWWPTKAPTSGSAKSPGPADGGSGDGAGKASPPVVAHPWQQGETQRGIQIYWEDTATDSDEVVRAKARRALDYIISLNADSIAVSFPFYTSGIKSNDIFSGPHTPSPERLSILLDEAAKSHLRAAVRPILNEDALTRENPIAWRGTIQPSSRAAWFANYQKFLLPYAQVVEAHHAVTFVIATEFNSLQADTHWTSLVNALSGVFHGELLYSMNYDVFTQRGVKSPVPTVGVDAYPELHLPDGASVASLVSGWNAWLDKKQTGPTPNVVLTEAGIAAQDNAYAKPGSWGTGSQPLNLDVQVHWYQAVCQFVQQRQIGGIYWWNINFDADPANTSPAQKDRLTFVGRPAADEIKACFAQMSR
jgi:hypothetical protein